MLATRFLALALIVFFSAVEAPAQVDEGEAFSDEFGFGQVTGFDLEALPPVDSLGSDWAQRFTTPESMSDFKRLREYRTEKQTRIDVLREQVGWYPYYRTNADNNLSRLSGLRLGLEGDLRQATGDVVNVSASLPVVYDQRLGAETPGPAGVQQVQALVDHFKERERETQSYLGELANWQRVVNRNISGAEADLRQVEAAIDSALAPELRSQDFRASISMYFSLLIGVLIVGFFTVIYVRSDRNMGSLMLSDGGLQFVTIFVLIIAIVLFGILSILEGKELAAILSGLAGYILGRGSQGRTEGAPAAADAAAPRRLVRRAGVLAARAPAGAANGAATPGAPAA